MNRREFVNLIGAGSVGTMIGYYVGARELLGIQGSKSPVDSSGGRQQSGSNNVNTPTSDKSPTTTPTDTRTQTATSSNSFDFIDRFERDQISRFVPIEGSSMDYWSIRDGIDNRSLVGGPEGGSIIMYDPERYGWSGNRRLSVEFLCDTDYSKQLATLIFFDGDRRWSISASVPLNRLRLRRSDRDPRVKDANTSIEAGSVHRLTVDIQDNSLTIMLDGDVEMEHTHDATIGAGTVGLGSAFERLTFYDNMRIKSL